MKATSAVPESQEAGYSSRVVILDIYSIPRWEHSLRQWLAARIHPIVLLEPHSLSKREHLRLIQLGVRGIITISSKITQDLTAAIEGVAQGQLWVDRDILEEYVKQRDEMLHRLPEASNSFTSREHQVLELLLCEFTNRQIAAMLKISERTVKFHVRNILQKTNAEKRRILIQSAAGSACVMNYQLAPTPMVSAGAGD